MVVALMEASQRENLDCLRLVQNHKPQTQRFRELVFTAKMDMFPIQYKITLVPIADFSNGTRCKGVEFSPNLLV